MILYRGVFFVINTYLISLFPKPTYSKTSLCKNENQIAEIIVSYLRIAEVYDRVLFATQFAERNKENPLKAKPLKIRYMHTCALDRELFRATLRDWRRVSVQYSKQYFDEAQTLLKERSTEKGRIRKLFKASSDFGALVSIVGDALSFIKPSQHWSVVTDDQDVVQGACVSVKDNRHSTAWEILFLITAPHNLKCAEFDEKSRVEGAATSLIEEAVVQSIKHKGLKPFNLTEKEMSGVAVTLRSTLVAAKFYAHIYFSHYVDTHNPFFGNNKILKGENLLLFLEKYGGRAKSPDEAS